MRKSGFLTFLFSLLPGAGHMYLNMMKKGVCIMSLFFALWGVGAFLRLDFLQLLLPVVWFYAFFDVMNIRHLPSV